MRARILSLAAVVCVLTAQVPAPTSAPLPQIGRTRAKGFCTMLRDNVAPALRGLMKTDDLVAASHRAMAKMAHDQVAGSPADQDLDRVYENRVIAAMAKNLIAVRRLLADEQRFPKKPVTDDDRYALLLKTQLQAAADRQNEALNHVNGILETGAMATMKSDIDTGMVGTLGMTNVGKQGSNNSFTGDPFMDSSAIPGAGPMALYGNTGPPPSTLKGGTIWDRLVADIEVQQARIAGAEQTLTPTVVAASLACRGEDPSPAPTAAP